MEPLTSPDIPQSPQVDADTASAQAVLQERRQGLHKRLLDGATGAEVVNAFTDLVDAVLIARYRNVLRREGIDQATALQACCLVAVGGYGRRELAPYSDIDVMVLFHTAGQQVVSSLSSHVFYHLWDLGFQVGHSVRSIQDCLSVAGADLSARTAMMESRFLVGNADIFQDFRRRFVKAMLSGRRVQAYIQDKVEERQREYAKFGQTVYLLEPNIKKTKGGLRDLHLLQWIGMARYQAETLRQLADKGVLAHQDYLALMEAREFLWKVRALMHFHAGRAQEILTFEEQVRLAGHFGYADQPHLLAVEQFMQQYYRHTMGIHDRCMRFVDRATTRSWWGRVRGLWPLPLVEQTFRIADGRITVPSEKLLTLLDSPESLLRLFRLAQERGLTIDSVVLEEIQRHVESLPPSIFHTPAASGMFRQILSGPCRVAETLGLMHRAHVLEKLVPAFTRVRGLMQFNQYHKYTVDEHSLLAVKQCELLGQGMGLLGDVYREIKHKDLLHLALLIHDLGKGRPGDHSEVGKEISQKMAERLGLDPQEGRTLEFLVYRHLLMAHTAFRRDPFDDKVLVRFAREVKTPEILKKLFVFTAADIAAVGPDTLTKWKESLLMELYCQTLPEVSGGRESASDLVNLKLKAQEVYAVIHQGEGGSVPGRRTAEGPAFSLEWVESQLAYFPLRYFSGLTAERMASHLRAIHSLQAGEAIVLSCFNAELKVCEYTLVTFDTITPGIFMNATGVFAAKGLQVLDAQIVTREDGIVVDTFYVSDPDFAGEPPKERLESVGRTIVRILKGEDSVEHLVERCRRVGVGREFPIRRTPTEVQIDNETSDRYTIIDIFADDRQGLLYIMARSIFRLGLSIHAARIATRLDQVVDVFYVTGPHGGRIDDSAKCEIIQMAIQQDLDRFLSGQDA